MARRRNEITSRQLQRLYPHAVPILIPANGLGSRLLALHAAAGQIAPDRHGTWSIRGTSSATDAAVFGFATETEAQAFRDWMAASGIDWTALSRF